MKRADYRGRVDVWDVVLYVAESLYVLAQGFTFFLWDDMQIACLAMSLVAPIKAPTNLWHKSDQEEIESTGKCINHDMTLGLSAA